MLLKHQPIVHIIIDPGKDSGLLTYFSTFPSSWAALSRHCSSEHGEEQSKMKSTISYIALSYQFDIKNAVSSCYWNWVKLKQMTSAPFSFRWTNFFLSTWWSHWEESFPVPHWLMWSFDLPFPTSQKNEDPQRCQCSGWFTANNLPPGVALGWSLAHDF